MSRQTDQSVRAYTELKKKKTSSSEEEDVGATMRRETASRG